MRKRAVKRFDKGGGILTDRYGNPVRSGSGQPVRTRSDDEIAESMKRPFSQITPKVEKPSVEESRPTAGPEDYATLGSSATKNAASVMRRGLASEPVEESPSEESPKGIFSNYRDVSPQTNSAVESSISKTKPEKVVKKKVTKTKSSEIEPSKTGKLEKASYVMERGRASTDSSGLSPMEKYTRDKEAKAFRDKRKMDLAVERVKAGVGYKSGGKTSSASSRADGIATRGKTRGRIC